MHTCSFPHLKKNNFNTSLFSLLPFLINNLNTFHSLFSISAHLKCYNVFPLCFFHFSPPPSLPTFILFCSMIISSDHWLYSKQACCEQHKLTVNLCERSFLPRQVMSLCLSALSVCACVNAKKLIVEQ